MPRANACAERAGLLSRLVATIPGYIGYVAFLLWNSFSTCSPTPTHVIWACAAVIWFLDRHKSRSRGRALLPPDRRRRQAWRLAGQAGPGVLRTGPRSVSPAIRGNLADVAAISATNAWAVGSSGNATTSARDARAVGGSEILHWNGETWTG